MPRFKLIWNKQSFLVTAIYFLLTLFFLITAGSNIYGGDTVAYWGFATSFANGNYPVHSPWQPDLLANHHQGAYLYQGAVQSLTGVDMRLIHSLFAALVVSAGFFLVWGWVRKLTNLRFASILPALVMYFSFGAIFIVLPETVTQYFHSEANLIISNLPTLADAKPRLGGAASLNDLFYLNHRATAIGGLLLLLILLIIEFRIGNRWKLIVIAILSVLILSADEITLPAIGSSVIVWSIYTFIQKQTQKIKLLKNLVISLFIFILMFFMIGSALRDSLLTPSKEAPRFQFLLSANTIFDRLEGLKSVTFTIKDSNWMLILPDLRLIIVFGILAVVIMRDLWAGLILATGFGIIVAYFTSEHTFYPGNEGRFLDFMYPLFGLINSFFIVKLISLQKKLIFGKGLLLLGVLLFIPALIFSLIYLGSKAKSDIYPNLDGELPDYQILKWVKNNIPDKRILFIDGFLRGESHNYLSVYSIQNYGLMVPLSPASVRVHTPNWGPEAVDVVNTLNPLPLSQLKVEYIFITYNQQKFISKERQDDFDNPQYFIKTYSDDLGVLYKIREMYLINGRNTSGTISELSGLIGSGSNIYMDSPPSLNFYFWTTIMLAIKDKGQIYTKWTREGFNYIETKIHTSEPMTGKHYDYLILNSKVEPIDICQCKEVQKIWQMSDVVAYEIK